ncbi:MAG: type III polyketide synthase [Verrucomicrobiae bacterium]|nr:type III polyketide synthase [Verrucomicrobiae bacterium]
MPVYLHALDTLVPEFSYPQDYARDRMKELIGAEDRRLARLVHTVYNRSGIENRHSVYPDFGEDAECRLFKPGPDGRPVNPTTEDRNRLYAEDSRRLAVELGRKLFAGSRTLGPKDVTHVVFASCTGFCNPGPDFHLVRDLGLPDSVERFTLGFMGCYAAFPALRMARQFCAANPEAVVLVLCLELCTLHLRIEGSPDWLLANSLFADGAGAALVSAREPGDDFTGYRLDAFASALVPAGEADMTWDIGNHGFNIVLSSYVPEIIGAEIRVLLGRALQNGGLDLADIEAWAVHPGGRAILDKVVEGLGLPPDAVDAAREVLRRFGNMSSATIFFVLKEMLENPPPDRESSATTLAMAFGPGLTVETALLQRIGSRKAAAAAAASKPAAAAAAAAV